MPSGRPAKKYPDHATVPVIINLPGRVRNDLVEEAQGLPPVPPPSAPKPDRIDILRQYLTGESVLEPCGKPFPCQREDTDPEFHGASEYCGYCRIKVN